jgi:hypothetical protein
MKGVGGMVANAACSSCTQLISDLIEDTGQQRDDAP